MSTLAEDYPELRDMAVELINEAGRDVTIERMAKTPADAAKPWRATTEALLYGAGSTAWTCKGVFIELASAQKLGIMTITQNMTKRSSRCLLVAAGAGCPDLTLFEEVVDGVVHNRILSVQALKPGLVPLLYFLEVDGP
jgi:hypothetical protein